MQATGSSAVIRLQLEDQWGVLPATPAMIELSAATYGESLGSESEELISQSINPRRGTLASRNGLLNAGGTLPFELPVLNGEMFYYGALGAYTQTDVVVSGQNKKRKEFFKSTGLPVSFIIEKGFLDINQFFRFLGMKIGSLQFSATPEGIVTGSVELMGKEVANATTPFDTTPSTIAHNFMAGIDTVVVEGGTAGQVFTSFSVNINNGLYRTNALGSRKAQNVGTGTNEITGEMSLMFENTVLYNKWLTEEQTNLKVTFTRGNDSVEFDFHNVKLTGDPVPKLENQEGVNITFSWRALIDPVSGRDVTITVINDTDFDAIVTP